MADRYRHFTIERLADGVWAVLHRMDPPAPDAWAISNAGIIDLGDRTLVFDALMATDAASELREAARDLTGRVPAILVYSHAHNDHTWGAGALPEAVVIASERTRGAMLVDGPEEVGDFRAVLEDRMAFWSGAPGSEDALVRHDAPLFRPYWDAVAATLPGLTLRHADVAFEGRLAIHGPARHVELVASERAHAAGDVSLVVPEAGVAFCGDLLFIGCHPFLADGDLEGLAESLRTLEASGASRFVPGHGPVGTVEHLRAMARYVEDVRAIAAGPSDGTIPEAYRTWGFARFFTPNVQFCAAGGRQPEATDDGG